MISRPFFFALALLASTPAWAESPARPKVSVELQCLSLPQTDAMPIIRRLRSAQPGERAQAFVDLEALLDKGTAKLLGWPQLTTSSGQKATYEAVEEVRYPTEFEAGTASVYLKDNDGGLTKQPSHLRGTDTEPVASAFEVRNIGVTLEVEPTVEGEGKMIELAFAAQHVRLKSVDRWSIEHERTSEKVTEKVTQEQPRFGVFKVQNVVTLESGDHKLVGVFKALDGEDTLELFILGAEVAGSKMRAP